MDKTIYGESSRTIAPVWFEVAVLLIMVLAIMLAINERIGGLIAWIP